MENAANWRTESRTVYSSDFKLRMVELASRPDANVAQLAREHGVDNNLIFKWLRLWQREGRISRRMPATIVGPVVPQSLPASPTLLSVDVINDPLPAAENDTLCTFSSAHASATSCHVEFRHGKMTLEKPVVRVADCADPRTDREDTMISLPSGTRIWLVAGATDMRKSFNGLGEQIHYVLDEDPFSGHLFIFRGRRGDTVKILWADADGLCLFIKRLEEGQFVWPAVRHGKIAITRSQLAMLLDKLDWRQPKISRLNSLTML